jgi:hypothetical protein
MRIIINIEIHVSIFNLVIYNRINVWITMNCENNVVVNFHLYLPHLESCKKKGHFHNIDVA